MNPPWQKPECPFTPVPREKSIRVSSPLNSVGGDDESEDGEGAGGYRLNDNTARTPSGRSRVNAIKAFSVLGGANTSRPFVGTGFHTGSLMRAWAHRGENSEIDSVGMIMRRCEVED